MHEHYSGVAAPVTRRVLVTTRALVITRVLVVVCCMALLLFSATLQVAHFHADGQLHSDCTVCHSAHQSFAAAAPPDIHRVLLQTTPVARAVEQLASKFKNSYTYWNRPPPDRTVVALQS